MWVSYISKAPYENITAEHPYKNKLFPLIRFIMQSLEIFLKAGQKYNNPGCSTRFHAFRAMGYIGRISAFAFHIEIPDSRPNTGFVGMGQVNLIVSLTINISYWRNKYLPTFWTIDNSFYAKE
jgi:hypothetical protein